MYNVRNVIYKATNSINGKVYIGYTSQKFRDRIYVHKQRSKSNDNKWKTKFYNAIRKYGWESFSWEIVEVCENVNELANREVYWIAVYNSYLNGYNSTVGGDGTIGFTGEDCCNSKLTEQLVIAVKKMLVEGFTHKEISEKLDGVTTHMVADISRERTWKHISVNGWDEYLLNKKTGNFKINESDILAIQKMLISKTPYKVIASEFNVSIYTISDIANGRTWTNVFCDGWDDFLKRDKSIGNTHGMSKLKSDDVIKIKTLLMNGVSRNELAETFNVSLGAITSIVGGRNWKNVTVDGWDEWVSKNRRKSPKMA